jgi:hypothetical protein
MKLGITKKYIYYILESTTAFFCAISIFITYNEKACPENLYTEFYRNRAKQLGITKKYINYVQERTTASCWSISMFITYNEQPCPWYLYNAIHQNREKQLGITKNKLITSFRKLLLPALRSQCLSHIRNNVALRTYITTFIKIGTNN